MHQFGLPCETIYLRWLNSFFLFAFICPLAFGYRQFVGILKVGPNKDVRFTSLRAALEDIHTGFNISLFPPLFFFSALFYTDIASTAFVLLSYMVHLSPPILGLPRSGLWRALAIMLSGFAALLFRQTNIFWVALFLAGLEAVHFLKERVQLKNQERMPLEATFEDVITHSWNGTMLYDPSIEGACLQGGLHDV